MSIPDDRISYYKKGEFWRVTFPDHLFRDRRTRHKNFKTKEEAQAAIEAEDKEQEKRWQEAAKRRAEVVEIQDPDELNNLLKILAPHYRNPVIDKLLPAIATKHSVCLIKKPKPKQAVAPSEKKSRTSKKTEKQC
jgi:hypothetical protein